MPIDLIPEMSEQLEYISPWIKDPNTWRMWQDIYEAAANYEVQEIIRALQEGQRVILEYSNVQEYYEVMNLVSRVYDNVEYINGLSSTSIQVAEQFTDTSAYVEAGDFASAMAQNFSNYINYLGAVVSNKINHVCTTIYKLLAEGDASYIVEDMQPAMLQIGALLTMSLPVAAAAVAPLFGFAVGYGLYSLNPEFWTKISQTLLPWCYPDTNVIPAPTFPITDETTGEVTGWQVYFPHDMILAFEQFLKDYGGGSTGDYWYINDFNGNPIRLGLGVLKGELTPIGFTSAPVSNNSPIGFVDHNPPSPVGYHVLRSTAGYLSGVSSLHPQTYFGADFFLYQEPNLKVTIIDVTEVTSVNNIRVNYKTGSGIPSKPILRFELSANSPVYIGKLTIDDYDDTPTYSGWTIIESSCTINEGYSPLDSYVFSISRLYHHNAADNGYYPDVMTLNELREANYDKDVYLKLTLIGSVWLPDAGGHYTRRQHELIDIPIREAVFTDMYCEWKRYNSTYNRYTWYGRLRLKEAVEELINRFISAGYDIDVTLFGRSVITADVYGDTARYSDMTQGTNLSGQTSPYFPVPNPYQILSPWIHSFINRVDSENMSSFRSTTSKLEYGSPIQIDEEGFTKWEGQQVPDYTSGQIKIWSEYDPETNSGKYKLYDPVTIPIGDDPFITSPPEKDGETTNPVEPVETPEILPYLYPTAQPFQYPMEIPTETGDPTINPEYGKAPTEYPVTDPEGLRDPQIPATEIYDPPITIKPPIPDPPIPPPLGISPPTAFPIEPIPGIVPVGQSGLIHVYNPTNAAMYNFGRWLWVTLADSTIEKIWNNPFDGVIGAFEIYCTPNEGAIETIRSGFLDSRISAPVVTDRYVTINCGTLAIPEYYQNYLDYGPYTKTHIYLPFIGIHELDTDHIVGFSVNVTYHIDCYSGVCVAMITHAKKDYSATIYQFSGNCSNDIPLSGGSQAAIKAGQIQANANTFAGIAGAVTSAAGGIAAGAASGGVLGAIAGGLIGAAPSLLQTNAQNVGTYLGNKSSVQHSGTFSGNEGAMGIKKPYLIIERPVQKNVLNYSLEYGYPSHKKVQLGACNGYVRVREVHVNSPNATGAEKAEIEKLLKQGVFIND